MPRYAFRLRIRGDRIEEYDALHQKVWPELLAVIKGAGIRDYSIFRDGVELFCTMRADDFERAWSLIEASEVNQRWQTMVADMFDPPATNACAERFPMMREVFFLP